MAKENPSARRSVKMLEEGLIRLMALKPFTDITISELCKRADLSRPTFYQHFNAKEDVLSSIFDSMFDEFTERAKKIGVKSISEMPGLFFGYWDEHYDFLALLKQSGALNSLSDKFQAYMGKILLDLKLAPEGKTENELKYLYAFLSGGLSGMLLAWVEGDRDASFEKVASLVPLAYKSG